MLRLLYPRKDRVLIVEEIMWASGLVWTGREISAQRDSILGSSTSQRVAVTTALSRLPYGRSFKRFLPCALLTSGTPLSTDNKDKHLPVLLSTPASIPSCVSPVKTYFVFPLCPVLTLPFETLSPFTISFFLHGTVDVGDISRNFRRHFFSSRDAHTAKCFANYCTLFDKNTFLTRIFLRSPLVHTRLSVRLKLQR